MLRAECSMASSIVNGYFCASSCDVAKAKKGENPHPSTDPSKVDGKDNGNGPNGSGPNAPDPARASDPAVIFGGVLADLTRVNGISASSDAQSAAPPNRSGAAVDIMV
jgi:hypothetical protein